jgi:hypothetical protein
MGKRSLRIAGGDILVCVNLVGLDVVPEDVGWNVRRSVAQVITALTGGFRAFPLAVDRRLRLDEDA